MMIFQSTDAAKEIFTVRERGGNNFGSSILNRDERNQFLSMEEGTPNSYAKDVTLQQKFVYFGATSKNASKIHVSNKYSISLVYET